MTGLADALMMCGLRYGSTEAAERAGEWARRISRAAYVTSAHLAQEKGAFPLFDRDAYLAGETVRELDEDVRALIAAARHPQRAAHLDRADRHHLAVGRQRLERHRAGVRAGLHPQGAAAGRIADRGRGVRLRAAPFPARCSATRRRCRRTSSPPRT